MKICMAARFFDFRGAGLGRVAMEIRDRLIARSHDVRTVSTNRTSLPSYLSYTAFEMPFRLPRGCDVYHAVTPMEAMWLPTKKCVVTFHDLFLLTDPDKVGAGIGRSGWRNWAARNYFAIAANWAQAKARGKRVSGIVCVSEQTKRDLMMCFGVPSGAVRVIRSGIRPDLEPMPKPDGRLKFGYLGQLDRRKRVDLLINAFKESKLDAELWIAGIGVDEAKLKLLAGGDPRIDFLGLIPDSALCKFYNSIDVFIMPTFIEGYGLSAVEAMACRKPVVVLRDAVMPDEIMDRCIIVDSLIEYFNNEDLIGVTMAGIDCDDNYGFAKSHDWEGAVDAYEALYEEVAC